MRVLFIGMLNAFSLPPLQGIVSTAVDTLAVVVPAATAANAQVISQLRPAQELSDLPIVNPYVERTIVHIAWERGIPVLAVADPGAAETLAAIAALRPDVAFVACFPYRLPAAFLDLFPLGCLNLHPSLLPAYRGPAPLFWIFRDGGQAAGATLHFMDEGLDSGDVARQRRLTFPDGLAGREAEYLCAKTGGKLIVEAIGLLQTGTLSRRPQPPGGSYFPAPSSADFTLDTAWPARRAFNFMRGTAEWGHPYLVEAGGAYFRLVSAVAYTATERLGRPFLRSDNELSLQFTPGVLRATGKMV